MLYKECPGSILQEYSWWWDFVIRRSAKHLLFHGEWLMPAHYLAISTFVLQKVDFCLHKLFLLLLYNEHILHFGWYGIKCKEWEITKNWVSVRNTPFGIYKYIYFADPKHSRSSSTGRVWLRRPAGNTKICSEHSKAGMYMNPSPRQYIQQSLTYPKVLSWGLKRNK